MRFGALELTGPFQPKLSGSERNSGILSHNRLPKGSNEHKPCKQYFTDT